MPIALLLLLLAFAPVAWATPADEITPRSLPIPEQTEWRPVGCRSVPFTDPVLLPRTAFRRAHGDLQSSDEVELAYPPVFERQWIAEPSLYQVTTPAFDGAGNLYMTPLLPHEPILMISLDGATGARRFVVPLEPGQRGGGAAPMVLREPESGSEVVYVNSYARLIAVRTDGTIMWDVPTGLGDATTPAQSPIGLAWVPTADAIVATTRDGFVVLHDRLTGAPLLEAPLQLPGEPTPPREQTAPPALAAQVDELLAPLVAFRAGGTVDLINVLLGGDSEVANNFSVDPRTRRLWIAATARDGEDGHSDGISELGALYRFDVVIAGGGRWQLDEVCHRSFPGGSASTPTLDQSGARVYLGDDVGSLIAVDAEDCGGAWSVPLGAKIFGSVAASADGHEIYASSASGIYQVFDDGDQGRRGWTASLDVYDIPSDLAGYGGLNLLLVGAGANGLFIQVGAGIRTNAQSIPVRTGIALVDRATGEPRWFSDGLEESLAAMSTGPDGSLYLSHAPLRRAFALALGSTTEPLIGGISKWGPSRRDLLARDAACAAADRAENALAFAAECPESARADADQIMALRDQVASALAAAVGAGEIGRSAGARLQRLVTQVGISPGDDAETFVGRFLRRAESALGEACEVLSSSGSGSPGDACLRARVPSRLAGSNGSAGTAISPHGRRCVRSSVLTPRRPH